MSLRKQAEILGVNAGHLSRMVNGKRPWKPELKARYEALVGNTFGNTQDFGNTFENIANGQNAPFQAQNREVVELGRLELPTSSMPLKRSHDNSSAYGGIKHHPTPSSSHKIALRDYIQSLHNRGLSDNYIETSEKFLRRYLDWLGNTLATLSTESAEKYLSLSNHLKLNTRKRYADYLRAFLKYHGMAFGITIKKPHLLPEVVSDEDIEKLKDAIRNHQSWKMSVTNDLAIIETLAKTGMRRAELANLTVGDVDLNKCRVLVHGKGNKDRVIPFGDELCEILTEICHGRAETERVFGMTKSSLGVKIHKWAVKAGVKLHTHSFRHYFATKLVERGANLRVVQELLGHTSLATTQVYLSVTAGHLEEAIELLD